MNDNVKDYLADTWKYFPDKPVLMFGYPITCPGCGSAEDIQFWMLPHYEQVHASHQCVPATARGRGRTRSWDEPRVTKAVMRTHGIDQLSSIRLIQCGNDQAVTS